MMKWFKICWKWSWVITLPVVLTFFYLAGRSINTYREFGIRYYSPPLLKIIGSLELKHFCKQIQINLYQYLKAEGGGKNLPSIHLFIAKKNIDQLNTNLPHSGRSYMEGGLFHNGKLRKVKVKYRGDNLYHYANYKKSWRIKTKKDQLYKGMRRFNLIAPLNKNTKNYLSAELSRSLGLITPHVEMVNLILNGKNQGIFALVEQLEELTLRRHHRMPGDIYSGETIGVDIPTPVIFNNLFHFPGIWEKRATNNHYPEESIKPLENLISLIRDHNIPATHEKLEQLLDMEAWGRFSAFETLAQIIHYDNRHNWRLYFDPAKGCFEPIAWDPSGFNHIQVFEKINSSILDIISSELHMKLFKNANFLRARHQTIELFFTKGKDHLFLKKFDQFISRMEAAIDHDPNLHSIYSLKSDPEGNPASYKAMWQNLRHIVEKSFNEIRGEYLGDSGKISFVNQENASTIPLSITGRRPVKKLTLNYLYPVRNPVNAKIAFWKNGQQVEHDISDLVDIQGARVQIKTNLIAQFSFMYGRLLRASIYVPDTKFKPAYYELKLKGIGKDNHLLELIADRGGKPESAISVKQIQKVEFHDMYSIVHPHPVKRAEIWEGVVNIDNVREINNTLIIQPGTTIRLGPGAGLIIRERLIAEGTKKNPIHFLPDHEGQKPWSTIALFGRGSNGSRLSYCEFAGGSGFKGELLEYSAMFSIHDVSSVQVNHCRFYDNKQVDDMVHAVYSDIRFSDCIFERSHSDAIDLDICKGMIERSRFSDSGNDAIDIMATRAAVLDTLFERSGDKGISVGEGSRCFAVNNQIVDNEIGVQSKDGSVASLFNVTFVKNQIALDAYKKNWRYGAGGKIFLYKGQLLKNQNHISADKHSLIKVYDSYVDHNITSTKNILIHPTVDANHVEKSSEDKKMRFLLESILMKDFSGFMKHVSHSRRGSINMAIIN